MTSAGVPAAACGAAADASPFALDRAWRLHPQVAIRYESFGALAYHFGTRRLSFLKSPTLRAVVEALADHPTAREAVTAQDVPDAQLPTYTAALATLAGTDMIIPRETS